MSNLLRGTMLLTGATFLSKFLGIIYVIPFEALIGHTGSALYAYAYNPYMILISISTMGIPLAMSKFVSKYNAMGDYQTGRRMFKSASLLMFITGIVAFLFLFFSAPILAPIILPSNDYANSVEDVIFVIRMVSFALIIIPSMSIVRGFFQGYGSMGPTAVSQVMEQVIRIIFLLASVFILVKVVDSNTTTAVGMATFAAFVGALGSWFVLGYFWKMRKPFLDQQVNNQRLDSNLTTKDMYKELLSYAGPFVLVGIATPIYQTIDQLTFNRAMAHIGLNEISETLFSVIALLGHKLVIIPVTVATGLSLALLPVITKSFTEKQKDVYIHQINQALQIIVLVTIPAVVGLSLLSKEAYGSFYGISHELEITAPLLSWYAPVALFYGLFTVTASILQGVNKQNFALISLGIGVLIKTICNVPFIYLFEAKGAVFATGLAVAVASGLNLWKIKQTTDIAYKPLFKRTLLILIFTAFMTLLVLLLKWILTAFVFDETTRLSVIITVFVCAGVGGYVYLWLCYKSTLLERVLGARAKLLSRIFI
ncbi:oligosaccharide flippase family protein [Salinibacillus xinjiangensis]|uniref:Oligosaccharide flippase family protein n=2 Tax=Salinibacillus xinjiangensis TaxID=1229268 RepID=A0A6G1X9U9_9BACI|nr:oligosaccharide flippase family protein [Salinibacillus xinjiangensis]